MNQPILALFAKPYNFKNDKEEEVKGCTFWYLPYDGKLDPVINSLENSKGIQPIKVSLPIEYYDQIPMLPAVYDAEFMLRTTTGGKATYVIKSISDPQPITGKM